MQPESTTNDDIVMPSGFRRVDLVRLMTQCLSTLGYEQATCRFPHWSI